MCVCTHMRVYFPHGGLKIAGFIRIGKKAPRPVSLDKPADLAWDSLT